MSVNTTLFYINGKVFPSPARPLSIGRYQMVDSARNANGVVVAQKIGKRQIKLEGLKWKGLDAETWHQILQEIEKFEVDLRFYDDLTKEWVTKHCYWGDAKESVLFYDEEGHPSIYEECSCNIIDMGSN